MADYFGAGSRCVRLRVNSVTGQNFDEFGIERGTFWRKKSRPMLTPEVVGDNSPMKMIRDDQIIAGFLILAGEQQMCIVNNDGVWMVSLRKPLNSVAAQNVCTGR